MPAPKLPEDLLRVFAALSTPEDIALLFSDLLTPSETVSLGERWEIVKLLASGHSERTTRDSLGVSVTTVSRGSRQLKYGHGGFALAFDRLPQVGGLDPREQKESRAGESST